MAIFGNKTEDKKDEKQSDEKSTSTTLVSNPILQSVLVQPRISEKASRLAKENKYIFTVTKSSNKIQVKKAIESAYKVRVVQVNIVNNQGKNRTFGRTVGKTSGFKKAIVTLKKGDSIGD